MRTLVIVKGQITIQGVVQLLPVREVAPPKGHPPMLLQNGALKALHKAVGPGMSGLDASVADPQLTAGLIKGALNSLPRSVSPRWIGQPAVSKRGMSCCCKKRAACSAPAAGMMVAAA